MKLQLAIYKIEERQADKIARNELLRAKNEKRLSMKQARETQDSTFGRKSGFGANTIDVMKSYNSEQQSK